MEQNPINNQVSSTTESSSLEEGLQVLWERVRKAGETVVRLRAEKGSLESQVARLEDRARTLQSELQKKEEQLRRLTVEQAQLQARGPEIFSNGEREAMEARLRDLLSRLEAYL